MLTRHNSDAIKEVNAKGENSTFQMGKDTNIVRKIYQLSRFNDYDSLRKQFFWSRFQLHAWAYLRI